MNHANYSCNGEISIEVQGGIGNQLFQISNGLNLSYVNEIPVSFNFLETPGRSLIQNFCGINHGSTYFFEGSILKNAGHVNHTFCHWAEYREKNFFYEPIKNIPNHMIIKGYFQSFKYFLEIEKYIRENIIKTFDLSTCDPNVDDIGIHLRLGDYYRVRKNRKIYLLPNKKYISDAINRIHEITKKHDSDINIFTDDEILMKKFYGSTLEKLPHFVFNGNNMQSFTKLANHTNKIISNSTFSWWAAWATEGNVVSPDEWFLSSSKLKLIKEDLFPENWELLPMDIKN
jgi:hypothetical protein